MFKSSSLRLCTRVFFVFIALILAVPLQSYQAQAAINPDQDYDIIQTLTFNTSTGNCAIRLYRGSTSTISGTVYYRAGTSGDWTSLSVSDTSTTFPISSTTMQVGHNWNKSGNDYMTCSFYGETKLTKIAISQKAALSGTMGNYFMYSYARGCTSLTSLDVPDTSSVTTIGDSFMRSYAYGCTSLTSLDVPDTSGLTTVGNYFMYYYANGCSSLTSLDVPDTSGLTTVGNYFMYYYAYGCTSLTSLDVPDTSSVTTVGANFMDYYAYNCTSLTSLILPAAGWFKTHDVSWNVPSGRLNYLKGYVIDSGDLQDWKDLTVSGKTLYTNYIRDDDNVVLLVTAPTVTTDNVTNIEETTATGNGNITSLSGGDNCTVRGFQYDVDSGAPYAYSAYDSGSFGTGAYTKALTGLTKGELYYIRAYATSPLGTGYGSEVTFLTKPDAPTGFSATAGDSKVDLSWTKGSGAQKTMVRFRTDGTYPTSYTDGTQAYFDTASTYSHTGLTNGTTYKYRMWSYATEGGLTQYSDSYAEATATPAAVPIVTTNDATAVEETTATAGGNITSLSGGGNATVRGVEYDIDSGAPYANSEYTEGSYGTGTFDIALTGLAQGELYYYRAYATNPTGTGYGAEKTFLTKPDAPTNFDAVGGGETIIDLSWAKGTGADYTIIRGQQGSYPANITSGTEIYNNTGTSCSHTGLSIGQTWYYRAWSYTASGALSQYSDTCAEDYASTLMPPSVTTVWCTGFDRTWAIVNGTIIAQGDAAVTQIGFDYGLTSSYGLSWTESGTYTAGQSFNAVLTGLSPATVYHFRAKAYNGAWGCGNDMVFSTKGSPTLYEEHNAGGDADSSAIFSANQTYQTFTTNTTSIAHTVTSIKLMLKRTASPGTVTVSIRHTAGGVPTGADLVTSTLNANTFGTGYTWYEFETAETSLEANTTYAIVVCAVTGDASNYVSWQRQATGTYAGGNAGYSTDSGSTWTSAAPADQLFEIWGNPCLEMEDAKVISGYLNTGDWLITCLYKNIYPPYYTDGTDVSSVFYLQLVDGSTVKAQTKVAAWGYKPGSIYLSTDMVAGLEWGKAYKVRIWGDFGSNPYMEYSLQSADWLGSALIRLDSWVRSAAVLMEQYYGTPLTVYIADRGLCLNSEGGVTFIAGIPELSAVRPALFQTVIQQLTYTPPEYTQAYQDELVWQTAIGSQLAAMFTEAGNIFSLDGATVGAIIAFIFYAVIAALAFAPGHAIAAIVLPIPFLLAAWYIGFIALVVMGVVCSVAALLLVWQMWWKQG